jgi:hypothetical protein
MKVVDKIETSEHVEKLTGEQRDDFFVNLVKGKDVTEEIETSKGKFTVKYPKSKDHLVIGQLMSLRRNYKPADAFDKEFDFINAMVSTLDVVVVSGPKWFEDAKKANLNFSFAEVPSRAFLTELYGKARIFREEVEPRFSETEESADKRVPPEAGDDASMDGGAFGGLSSE